MNLEGWASIEAETEALLILMFLTKGCMIIERIDREPC